MKKLFLALLSMMMILTLAGCSSAKEEKVEEVVEETPVEKTTGEYTLFNMTGSKVTELYLYEVGADKGANLVEGHAMKNTGFKKLSYEGYAEGDNKTVLVLESVSEDGTTCKFETLHIETTDITLLAADARTGATEISFFAPENEDGVYTVYNTTGSTVTELYIYDSTGSDKGTNYAGEGLADGESVEVTINGRLDTVLILEFVAEDGTTGSFNTLHIEVAPISLLAADARTGATEISFFAPEK